MKTKNAGILITILATAIVAMISGCSSQASDLPAQAVEGYLEALVAQDAPGISNQTCAAWEDQAILEMDSFQAVKPTLEDLSCMTTESSGDEATVTCEGKIVTTYDAENREFDLSLRTYSIIKENGTWLVCGYFNNP